MLQLLLNDFIKNRIIQLMAVLSIICDVLTSQSINHVLLLFGIPYLTSVLLGYLIQSKKTKIKARISEQYRHVK